MNLNFASSDTSPTSQSTRVPVSLSCWVNEERPPLNELLSAHDVARLTRRHRLIVAGLALCGRLPKRRRYYGGVSGWLRSEVMDWMARSLAVAPQDGNERISGPRHCARRHQRQVCLPLECREPCVATRKRSRGRRL